MDGETVPPGIDTTRAHPARVYDYWLGGKDNFAADREAAEQALQAYPQLAQAVQANRKFLAGAARTLDFGQPVALMLLAILQFIPDEQDPAGLVSRLVAALPSGSYLVISHPTDDFNPNRGESIKRYNERVADQATLRDQAGTTRFFAGLDLVEPGVVPVASWRPDSDYLASMPSSMWCGVARKPQDKP